MSYIDVNKKIKQLQAKCVNCIDYNTCTSCYVDKMIRELKNTPSADVVEVTRCKNCNDCEIIDDDSYYCSYFNKNVDSDGYCSYGG